MFIKLTKLDNSPVWLNASFVVTVEPRKGGGSIVVPIGDGLDYDVREKPEEVLSLLDGAPDPQVVPIPVSDCLTKTPEDVSPEPERGQTPEPERGQTPEPERGQAPKLESSDAAEPEEEAPAEEKPAKKTRSRAKSDKTTKTTAAKKPRTTRAKKPTLDLSEDEVARLRKMAPGSVNKLKNTLFSQFHVEDPSKTMLALEALGILSLDRDHIIWSSPVDKPANN